MTGSQFSLPHATENKIEENSQNTTANKQ